MAKRKSVTKLKSGKKAPPEHGRGQGLSKRIHDRYKSLTGHHMPNSDYGRHFKGLVNAGKKVTKLKSGKRKKK